LSDKVVKYVAFDPGETTGVAVFDEFGDVIRYWQIYTLGALLEFLETVDQCSDFIVEDFKIFGHKAKSQIGSRGPAQQAIGVIQAHCQKHPKKNIWLQPASVKSIAAKWTQVKVPTNHANSHQVDAYLHGSYFLIRRGIKKTALELELEQK
jgi:hypothetical protein